MHGRTDDFLQPKFLSLDAGDAQTTNHGGVPLRARRWFGHCPRHQKINSKPFNTNKVQNLGNESTYVRTSAKIQVAAIFLYATYSEKRYDLPKFLELCMEKSCWCPSGWAPTWRPETSRNICHYRVLKVVTEKTKRRKDFGNNKDNEIGGIQRRIKLGNTLDNFTTTLKIT